MSQGTAQDIVGHRCEGCGYALDGLVRDDVCSECGLAVALSLPRERAGTPWQQGAGLGSLVRTWWLLLRDDACWREVRIDAVSRLAYVAWLRVLAYALLVLAAGWVVLLDLNGRVSWGALTYLALLLVMPMLVVEIGMRFYGTLIGWRLDVGTRLRKETQADAAHQQVIDLASGGMLAAPVLMGVGAVCIAAGMTVERLTGSMAAIRAGFWSGGVFAALGLVLGLVLFELGYRRGWRAMRYRAMVGEEWEQSRHDDFDDALVEQYHLVDLLDLGSVRKAWRRAPLRVVAGMSGLVLRYIVTPSVFLVLWLVYGYEIALAIFMALMVLGVLSILQRMLMVPLRLVFRQKRRDRSQVG